MCSGPGSMRSRTLDRGRPHAARGGHPLRRGRGLSARYRGARHPRPCRMGRTFVMHVLGSGLAAKPIHHCLLVDARAWQTCNNMVSSSIRRSYAFCAHGSGGCMRLIAFQETARYGSVSSLSSDLSSPVVRPRSTGPRQLVSGQTEHHRLEAAWRRGNGSTEAAA